MVTPDREAEARPNHLVQLIPHRRCWQAIVSQPAITERHRYIRQQPFRRDATAGMEVNPAAIDLSPPGMLIDVQFDLVFA